VADSGESSRVDRRGFLTAAGVGAGVVAAGYLGSRIAGSSGDAAPRTLPPAGSDVDALFADLTRDGALGDCRIERVHGVHLGAIPVIMTCDAGTRFQIDVMRRDPDGPPGVGNTDSLSLYISNRGDGAAPTTESQGIAALTLARAIAHRQRSGATTPRLLTMNERHRTHAGAAFAVAL
jgi:hypothetical protein